MVSSAYIVLSKIVLLFSYTFCSFEAPNISFSFCFHRKESVQTTEMAEETTDVVSENPSAEQTDGTEVMLNGKIQIHMITLCLSCSIAVRRF